PKGQPRRGPAGELRGRGARPSPSIHPPGDALPVFLADEELLELAGGGARQRLDEVDAARALEMAEMVAREGDDLRLGGGDAGPEDDQRLRGFAPALARHADHGALEHRRVLVERVLDLRRGDVLPAGDDHVLLAVDDLDVAVAIPGRQVAGVEVAVVDDLR